MSFVDAPTLDGDPVGRSLALLYEIQHDMELIDPLTTDPDLLAVQLVKVQNKLTVAINLCEKEVSVKPNQKEK